MLASQLFLIALLPLIQAQETVLGAYIFHRHGDRTTKSYSPVSLTDLGYAQVVQSGNFFKNRYLTNSSSAKINGMSQSLVKLSQLNVESPVDNVLQSSAIGWLAGLYPPTSQSQTLANGTTVYAPVGGYQLIPVNAVTSTGSSGSSSSSNSESSAWLQGSSGCTNAVQSSNNYFISEQYLTTLASTNSFYQSILPAINTTFNSSTDTFKNAYTIYDYVHVSEIHNATIANSDVLTTDNLNQLYWLANQHEFGLAYNSSETIRAIAGSVLAAQIVSSLNTTIVGKSASKLSVQFGAYASFLSFFGLAQLPSVSSNFTGIVDYASAMVFELYTNATNVSSTNYPSNDNINVRFLFTNGTAAANPLTQYPLFGQSSTSLTWSNFVTQMNAFAIGSTSSWCSACGVTTGDCASSTTSSSSSATSSSTSSSSSSSSGSGMSLAVAGVIGAMVTLAVILGLEALALLLGGFRLVNKKRLSGASSVESGSPTVKA